MRGTIPGDRLSLALSAIALMMAGFTILPHANFVDDSRPSENPLDPWPDTGAWAREVLAEMTLTEKVSQLFVTHANGRPFSRNDSEYRRLVDLVENFGVGGIIFFQGEPGAQLSLTNDLQKRSNLPLLISQDMEWGVGMRLSESSSFPRAMAVGASRKPELAYAMGRAIAREARALGIHQNYAPVLDINNNPNNPVINVRSFGESSALVAELSVSYMQGLHDGGIVATAKHFPGHGDTNIDSHADLPVLPFTRTRLDTMELVPFRDAIQTGLQSIMMGHLALPLIEPEPRLPATLSRRITTGLLRDQLGFRGLVVTDALNMESITRYFTPGQAAVRAIEAGADVLLMSTDEYAAREAIMEAIRSGRLSESRINDSVYRILKTKEWLELDQTRFVDESGIASTILTPSHHALNDRIARESMTLLRNQGGVIPLLHDVSRVFTVSLSDGSSSDAAQVFFEHMQEENPRAVMTHRFLGRRATAANYDNIVREARNHDVIVVPAYVPVRSASGQAGLRAEHRELLNRLAALDVPVVLISFGSPYIISGISQPDAYLVAYGQQESAQKAAAQAIFGKSDITGRLPITIPGHYDAGYGLHIAQTQLRKGRPEDVGMDSELLGTLDEFIKSSIKSKVFPGASIAIGRKNTLIKLEGYGYHTYANEKPITAQSIYDLASLTKIVATTSAAMKLYEEGRLDLHRPVAHYLPEFGQNGKSEITIWNLLSHTSGLRAYHAFHVNGPTTRNEIIQFIMNDELRYTPGTRAIYSDFAMITLALVIEQITGEPLDQYAQREFFEPLGMENTGFRSDSFPFHSDWIVPTELDRSFRNRLVHGEVHDETAYLLGGTAGHAGLFSTAEDLAGFAQMLVNGGVANGKRFFREETIELFTRPAAITFDHTRALGWDTRGNTENSSAGNFFSPRSFGHTGFTGTSMWIDPDLNVYVILLTNRIHPNRRNPRISEVRTNISDMVFHSIKSAPEVVYGEWAVHR